MSDLESMDKALMITVIVVCILIAAVLIVLILAPNQSFIPVQNCTYKGVDAGRALYDCWKEAK